MNTSTIKFDSRVAGVGFDDHSMSIDPNDGRRIAVPLSWFPRLRDASPSERANWETCAASHGIHWPDLDEDLSVAGLVRLTGSAAAA